MTAESQTAELSFPTEPGEGLHAIVLRATQLTQGRNLEAAGLLELVPVEQDPRRILAIEVEISDDGARRGIAALDVRVACVSDGVTRALVERAVSSFGGLGFTSLAFGEPGAVRTPRTEDLRDLPGGAEEDAVDVTVLFPHRHLPFYAKNQSLTSPELTDREQRLGIQALAQLGVRCRRTRSGLQIGTHQLRSRMTVAAQVDSFLGLANAEQRASIYAAAMPPTQSVRIAQRPLPSRTENTGDVGQFRLEIDLCRGLSGGEITTAEEVFRMEQFLSEMLGIQFGGRQWNLRTSRWETLAERTAPQSRSKAIP